MPKETFENHIRNKFDQTIESILQELAHKGYTKAGAAKYLDCSQSTMTVYSSKYNIQFRTLHPRDKTKKKAAEPIDQLQAQINHHLSNKWI